MKDLAILDQDEDVCETIWVDLMGQMMGQKNQKNSVTVKSPKLSIGAQKFSEKLERSRDFGPGWRGLRDDLSRSNGSNDGSKKSEKISDC